MSDEEEPDKDAETEEEVEEEPDDDFDPSESDTPDVREDAGHEDLAVEEEQGIFAGVVGHKGAKAVVRGALRAGDVHVLLVGPPASGKSTMLDAIERNVPGTIYRDCKRFTGTQVQSTFAEDPPILLLDEFDALDDYDVLSNPLEHGRVTEDTHDETYDIEIGTQVIAACNHTRMIPDNIMSRFRTVHFTGYTEEEVVDVCEMMLPQSVEWVETHEEARTVAVTVRDTIDTTDPRDIRDVARMVSEVGEVEDVAMAFDDADADVESDPITPDEVERAKVEVGRKKLADELSQATGSMEEDEESGRVDPDEVDEEIEKAVEEELRKRDGG